MVSRSWSVLVYYVYGYVSCDVFLLIEMQECIMSGCFSAVRCCYGEKGRETIVCRCMSVVRCFFFLHRRDMTRL